MHIAKTASTDSAPNFAHNTMLANHHRVFVLFWLICYLVVCTPSNLCLMHEMSLNVLIDFLLVIRYLVHLYNFSN